MGDGGSAAGGTWSEPSTSRVSSCSDRKMPRCILGSCARLVAVLPVFAQQPDDSAWSLWRYLCHQMEQAGARPLHLRASRTAQSAPHGIRTPNGVAVPETHWKMGAQQKMSKYR